MAKKKTWTAQGTGVAPIAVRFSFLVIFILRHTKIYLVVFKHIAWCPNPYSPRIVVELGTKCTNPMKMYDE